MATLKEHQAAMVDLLATGSGIPASASRLAHAMHDVLGFILCNNDGVSADIAGDIMRRLTDATTPGLNDKALSKREKALKTDSSAKWPAPAEQRVKELENTIRQLKANLVHERACVAELRHFLNEATVEIAELKHPQSTTEQAGCRKPDTQVCEHDWVNMPGFWAGDNHPLNKSGHFLCRKCGAKQ